MGTSIEVDEVGAVSRGRDLGSEDNDVEMLAFPAVLVGGIGGELEIQGELESVYHSGPIE